MWSVDVHRYMQAQSDLLYAVPYDDTPAIVPTVQRNLELCSAVLCRSLRAFESIPLGTAQYVALRAHMPWGHRQSLPLLSNARVTAQLLAMNPYMHLMMAIASTTARGTWKWYTGHRRSLGTNARGMTLEAVRSATGYACYLCFAHQTAVSSTSVTLSLEH